MKKIILLICVLFNTLFSAQIEELSWQKGESFLTFLDIIISIYFLTITPKLPRYAYLSHLNLYRVLMGYGNF